MAKVRFSSNEILGARLRFARENAGLTQKELSDRLNIHPRNYSRYESGVSFPSGDVLVRLCKVLNVTSDFLLGISDSYASDAAETDYICLIGSDGSRHMYNIPKDKRDRVTAVLKAGFPEIMQE